MAEREWVAGDVAMISGRGGTEIGVCFKGGLVNRRSDDTVARWHTASDVDRWSSVSEARPLVVIDPEDREQVERLAVAYISANPSVAVVPNLIADRLTNALCEFADPAPPKPAEPLGLGAVVEDADGKRYVRCADGRDRWHCPDDDTGNSDNYYADIKAVKVLSEGVQ